MDASWQGEPRGLDLDAWMGSEACEGDFGECDMGRQCVQPQTAQYRMRHSRLRWGLQ